MAVSLLRKPPDIWFVADGGGVRSGPSLAERLLAAGIPLSLLVDLADADGPDSRSICATEQPDYALW
jgi:hypothetical protein